MSWIKKNSDKMKKKKSDKKKSDKKKNDKAQQILNYIIITILTVVCTFSYCQKKSVGSIGFHDM